MIGSWEGLFMSLSNLAYIWNQTSIAAILSSFWGMILSLIPWFISGLGFSAWLTSRYSAAQISSAVGRLKGWGLIIAALLGILSPIPTYTAIPLVVILLRSGAPPGPVIAFLISSPLMNPSIFLLTLGGLGLPMALARVFGAFCLSLIGAAMVRQLKTPLLRDAPKGSSRRHHYKKALHILDRGISPRPTPFWTGLAKGLHFATPYFLVAILIAACIQVLIPPELILKLLGRDSHLSVLASAAAGIPLYTCGGAAIPVVQTLANLGMNPGAILAFLITGPSTNLSTMVTLGALFRSEFLSRYYLATLGGAVALGYLYSLLL